MLFYLMPVRLGPDRKRRAVPCCGRSEAQRDTAAVGVHPTPGESTFSVSESRPKAGVCESLSCAQPGAERAAPSPLKLLDLDFGADLFKLLLDRRRLVFVHAFFDRLGRTIDQVLGFLQPKAGHFAHRLNHVNLVGTDVGQHDREFGLFLRRSRAGPRTRNIILLINSSLEGKWASCWISSIESTRPWTTPALNRKAGTSLATLVSTLASATGSVAV